MSPGYSLGGWQSSQISVALLTSLGVKRFQFSCSLFHLEEPEKP